MSDKWGEDDCITFALPELGSHDGRFDAPYILFADTESDAGKRAIKRFGSLREAWKQGLEHCGYREVNDGRHLEGDRFLGRDKVWGWTVGVMMHGSVWVKARRGRTRAWFTSPPSVWRKI